MHKIYIKMDYILILDTYGTSAELFMNLKLNISSGIKMIWTSKWKQIQMIIEFYSDWRENRTDMSGQNKNDKTKVLN